MRIGDRVSGRYKIIDKIGTGGMANVYLATDLILERNVAVKMMSLDFQEDQQNLRRFQREALSTTELTHPNIVNIYDVGDGSHPYIVMEYIEGMDLNQYIRENHPIPYYKVIDIMEQILDGITYAHENNVIHRDIKPHNILIDHNGHVKITDFGIAVALAQNSITQTNSLLGSVQYISPEQARGNIVTKQSDIYSLGIVLYELLAGTVPFDGESAVSIALKHFQTPIPSLRETDSRLPQSLENVVLKATAKEPMNRYATVQEMKEDLETALAASRRNEEVFIPLDLNDEKTMVLNIEDLKKNEANFIETNETKPIQQTNPEEIPKPEKNKRGLWKFLLIPLILIIGIGIYLYSLPSQVVISEDLIGMTLDEAIEKLAEQMLDVGKVIEQSNDEVDKDLIFRANPKTGSTVLEGSKVDLYISLGEKPFVMDDYTGKEYEEVRAKLTELGFEVIKEEESSDTLEPGQIIRQDLAADTEVISSETTITFVISTGKPVIELRNLFEYSRTSVEDYVERNGLNLTSEEQSSEEVAVGLVISQEPEAKTLLHAGDRIKVIYSTGPEEVPVEVPEEVKEITFSKQIELPYSEKYENPEEEDFVLLPNVIEIYIADAKNDIKDVAIDLEITSDQKYILNFTVEEGESASYLVYRDQEEIINETVSP